jgi:ornithine cyclodeaminase/alanine dehydrogenase-like protein (mu-crystallin family)
MTPDDPLLYLPRAALETLDISTGDVIAAIETLLRGRRAGSVWNTPKSAIAPGDGRYFMNTLSVADAPPYGAVKALGLNPANPDRGFEAIGALVVLHDSVSGWPLAVMEGAWVTAIRTAGLSATAAKYMARKDAAAIAFIGCGVQARSHLDAFSEMFPLQEIRAFGRGAKNRDLLCQVARDKGLKAVASTTAQAAIEGADLVVTSVPHSLGGAPFIDARWLKPGAFAAIVDLAGPWLADSLSALDRIVVDDLEQERAMNEPLVDPKLVAGDITGLATGEIAGRQTDDQTTAFVFRGLALGDLALAYLAYEAALKAGAGIKLER